MGRIACLLVPDLPLQAERRAHPELGAIPLALTSGPGPRAEIVASSSQARARGVQPGQTLRQARAVCPGLTVRPVSPALEQAAREALLDAALSLAPRAEGAPRSAGPFASEGAVYVDATGIGALHASESAFASRLHARAARAGLRGVVALASSRSLSRLVARWLAHPATPGGSASGPGCTHGCEQEESAPTRILTPGQEPAFLAPLPVDLLDPDDRAAQVLTRLGIRRVADLTRLPTRDLAARLGPGMLDLVARARGEGSEPPIAMPRDQRLREGIDLEHPIDRLEPLRFVLRGLVSRITDRLELRALGCTELGLSLELTGRGWTSRRVGVTSPTRDERTWLRRLQGSLESDPPPCPVEGVRLECDGLPLRIEQLDLFVPPGPAPSELDRTLAEIEALCGADRVGAPGVLDDHRPDAFELRPFVGDRRPPGRQGSGLPRLGRGKTPSSGTPPSPRAGLPSSRERDPTRAWASTGSAHLTLRMLRPPQPAEVRIAGGRPVAVRSAVGRGEVSAVAGPWRTTGHWWSESAHFAVDHYDVRISDGTVCRLRFDWKARQWQIDGVYD